MKNTFYKKKGGLFVRRARGKLVKKRITAKQAKTYNKIIRYYKVIKEIQILFKKENLKAKYFLKKNTFYKKKGGLFVRRARGKLVIKRITAKQAKTYNKIIRYYKVIKEFQILFKKENLKAKYFFKKRKKITPDIFKLV